MKTTKYLILSLFALLTTTLAACGSDDDGGTTPGGGGTTTEFVISPTELTFGIEGGTKTFEVKGGSPFVRADYDDASNTGWLKVNKGSTTASGASFSVVCEQNAALKERTAKILVNLNGVAKYVTVKQEGKKEEKPVEHTFRTASELAKDMYPGINLGNTLEAGSNANNWTNNGGLGAETSWQHTRTTQAVIDYFKQQGFKSVRIPVAWVMGHISNKSSVTIDPLWMARVKEVVDYCIKDGLYVILNDHWDGGWLEENVSTYDNTRASQLKQLWTAIAKEFQNYDDHLLFAGLNEPNADNQTKTTNLIKYEQDFINAVRATGGNNAQRTLIVQGPSTDIDNTDKYYTGMPTDPSGAGRLMMEVHFYPYKFCMMTKDESWGKQIFFWGKDNHVTGTYAAYNGTDSDEEAFVLKQMKKMQTKFVNKGYPVVLGEYGVIWRNLKATTPAITEDAYQTKHDNSIKLFHHVVNEYAINHGIIPFVWETNGKGQNSMDVLDRAKLDVFNQHALTGIKEGVKAASWMSAK